MSSRFDDMQKKGKQGGPYVLRGLYRNTNYCAKCNHILYVDEKYEHIAIEVPEVEFDLFGKEGARREFGFCPTCASEMLGKSVEEILQKVRPLQDKRDEQARKNQEEHRKAALEASGMPESVVVAFENLAHGQRGRPEEAMLDVQHFHSGVLNVMVEHIGDLTHRMAQSPLFFRGGYEWVHEKVKRGLNYLRRTYGFEREHEENIENNSRAMGVSVEGYKSRLDDLLSKYADEHEKLKVYNEAQWCAREAAIAIGRKNFRRAETMLARLDQMLSEGSDAWSRYALAYKLDSSGNPKQYPYTGTSRFDG